MSDQDSEKERAEYTKYMSLAVNIFSCNRAMCFSDAEDDGCSMP